MSRKLALLPLPALLLVIGCGTPQQQCIGRNTSEYRIVTELLAEVEANLARGYAWEEREVSSLARDSCHDMVWSSRGWLYGAYRPCLLRDTRTERYRVPIDPLAEARKRDGLAERLAALRPQAEDAVRACRAAYPET